MENLPLPRIHFSVRVTHPKISEQLLQQYYIINVENYLKKKLFSIVCMTGGLHLEASHPHIHLHYIITQTQRSQLNSLKIPTWKYYHQYQNDEIISPDLKTKYPCLHSYTYPRSKINISMKMTKINEICDTTPLEKCPNRYLSYPLKEGHLIASHGISEPTLELLTASGKGEFASAKIKSLKEKQKSEKTLGEYQQLVEFLNNQKPTTLEEACILALDHARTHRTEYKKHINPRTIVSMVQKYCFHTGIWQNSQILESLGIIRF